MAEQKEEQIHIWQTATPIEFAPDIAEQNASQSLLISTRQGAGFAVAAGQLGHAIQTRATHLLLDFSQTACAIRYQVDGAWEQLPQLDRETGDAMLYALKQLCLMNPTDRRSAQSGVCGLKAAKDKFTLSLQSKGTSTGERVLAKIEPKAAPFDNMSDLGMRDKIFEMFRDKINEHGNLVLISAPKGEGLTTTWVITINAADRLVRDFQSFELEGSSEPDIINVSPNYFGGETKLTQAEMVAKAILKEPDVLLFPELPDPEVLKVVLENVATTEKQIFTRIVAPNAVSALVQLISRYRESANEIAELTGAVLSQKLVRRLCDNCKIGYEPPPQLLKKLGIPAGRVAMLYNPFIPPPVEQQIDENGKPAPITPCHICNGRGYYGRIAIFELLIPGEQLKAALKKTQDISQLAQIAKSEGHRGTQNEAVLAVARGLTSLEELKKLFASK